MLPGHSKITAAIFSIIAAILPAVILSSDAHACDPCSLYNVSRLLGTEKNSFTISLSEQYTRFKSVSQELRPRDGEIGRDFSVTQFAVAYDFLDELGVQFTLPLVYRNFDLYERFTPARGSETGIGDMIISTNYTALNYQSGDWLNLLVFTFGIKLPTGDTGSLKKIPDSPGLPDSSGQNDTMMLTHKHHTVSGALGGRALSLGSGSVDYLFGASSLNRFRRYLLLGNFQYSHRTSGSFDYQFGNDLVWSFGPGYFVLVREATTIALRGVLSGEYKEKDTFENIRVDRSGINNTYVGPEVIISIDNNLIIDTGIDFLIADRGSSSLIIPSFRVRSGISYRF
jgi:hypothetical protein